MNPKEGSRGVLCCTLAVSELTESRLQPQEAEMRWFRFTAQSTKAGGEANSPRSVHQWEAGLEFKPRRLGSSALLSATTVFPVSLLSPSQPFSTHSHLAVWTGRAPWKGAHQGSSVMSNWGRWEQPGHAQPWLCHFQGQRDSKHSLKVWHCGESLHFFFLTHNSKRYYRRQSEVKGTFSKVGAMSRNKTLTRNISVKAKFLLH